MENSGLHYSWSDDGERENSGQIAIRKRRDALALFLENPEEAARQYPELLDDLRIFFIHSTNPYTKPDTEPDTAENDVLVNKWAKAQQWARANIGSTSANESTPAAKEPDERK